jgi:hypothetical protein
VVSEIVPEEVERRVWALWARGSRPADIAAWLAQIGYRMDVDEVAVIALTYEQEQSQTRGYAQ